MERKRHYRCLSVSRAVINVGVMSLLLLQPFACQGQTYQPQAQQTLERELISGQQQQQRLQQQPQMPLQQRQQAISSRRTVSRVTTPAAQPPVSGNVQGRISFSYNPASAAVTELARVIGAIMGQQSNAGVFSPVSIACALSLMLIGAEGETKRELVRVLGFQQFENNLQNMHQLYSQMLNDLAKTQFDVYPPYWRTANPCYDGDDEGGTDYDDGSYEPPAKDIIRVTNAVFVQDGVQLDGNFGYFSKHYYNSTADNVPFATDPGRAANLINGWAARSTEGKIREIVSTSFAAETEMVVASALYFKGLWSEMFEKEATELKPFYPDGHERPAKPVLTMAAVGCFPYYDATREFDAKIVGLSYQGNKSALYIIMPNNSTRQRMQEFQRNLTPAMIGEMVIKMTTRKMYLQLPKMRISNTINLRDVLQRLGLRTIFNAGQSDLSGMIARPVPLNIYETRFGGSTPDPSSVVFPIDDYYPPNPTEGRRGSANAGNQPYGARPITDNIQPSNIFRESANGVKPQSVKTEKQLHVSEFIHKVELDINEKGTEGGAITTSTIFRSLPSIHFRADAPFLLLLGHDETRLPLFYGSIYDPSP
ncbi:serine protease inhibitor 28Dc-like [Anopheles darlingi]|uniref:Serpin domain-containing protein n=2 Tax=Anopheles darlingi TaxID=43151 RepID=A0A087ZET8_ANODA|nr:serine protease inhibitor 28Dc-like [Anopheles darlingi]